MICRPSVPFAALVAFIFCIETQAQDTTAATEPVRLEIELNKLENVDDFCRAYFIIRNETGTGLTALELDTFLFDNDDIILQRLALPFGEAPQGRMRIVSFDLELGCETIGSLFVNDVLTCQAPGAIDCAGALATTSRARPSFKE